MNSNDSPVKFLHPKSGQWHDYLQLMRLDKPIGSLLLLWPTLWALLLASNGQPSIKNLIIFTLGVFLMRSAGCVINDYADRNFDGSVKRTSNRPLASGRLSETNALTLFVILLVVSLLLVLLTNKLTIALSLVGVLLAAAYPFAKRHTHLAQIVLGAAFSWSIPMAFTAESNSLPANAWLLYITNLLWVVVYDTFYAMVDRDDDLKIGVKSTAILFADMDRTITGLLQILTLVSLLLVGSKFQLGLYYYGSIAVTALLFGYQQYLIRNRERDPCFRAFLNNQWVGFAIFLGLALDYLFASA
ncbi:4-hydroxybenzoate octaprenyltransferase [Halioxenophilus sp. WMMB6]|uniref:4-hydroxybenzoate octaprenyltransferase n=1 Tax=Halioxenophilus sp. WMMB6 TaxID=3073815 RepID=UPI00295F1232|nr:4-hydroxybenzoate octaprenyltransferase [Halioxenophilus sp. WMMB6]